MLELGAQPVSVIAKYVGVPRSSMYVIMERLKKLHLVEEFERTGITYTRAISVNSIPGILKARERQIEHTLEMLEAKLPELAALENKLSITPQVKFLEGREASMTMYEEILREKDLYAAFNPGLMKKSMPEYYHKVAETLMEKQGTAKELLVDSQEAKKYKQKFSSSKHLIKILPPGVFFSSDIVICEQKIYMISYGENNVSATEVINSALALTQRVLFEELWKRIV